MTEMYPNSMENTFENSKNDFALDQYFLKMNKPLRRWTIEFDGKMM